MELLVKDDDFDFMAAHSDIYKSHSQMVTKKLIQKQFPDAEKNPRLSFSRNPKNPARLSAADLSFMMKKDHQKSYSYFNGLVYLTEPALVKILVSFLVIFMFTERYSFLVLVYKTKCTNYILLYVITILNTVLTFVWTKLKARKVEEKMHNLFEIDQVHQTPKFFVIFAGLLDMGYAFCLFWPANVLPIFVMVC